MCACLCDVVSGESPFESASAKGGKGKGKGKDKVKVRLLKCSERDIVKDIDREVIFSHVQTTVPKSLVESLYPERMILWMSISKMEELKVFILNAVAKYISIYDAHSKGKNKYANLYLEWIQFIRTFTCASEQTANTKAEWASVLAVHAGSVSEATQRTVIASILHAVQEGIQMQMAANIEELQTDQLQTGNLAESLSDDTALYRISGWALMSAIQLRKKAIQKEKHRGEKNDQELQLLSALKRTQASKCSLPIGAQYLDRGGLTFVHQSLLPWVRALEASMKLFMNQTGYQKYGKNIFKVYTIIHEH